MARKKEEPKIQQPSLEEQLEYKSMTEDIPTEVSITGTKKKYLIRWLKNGTIEYLSRLLVGRRKTDNDDGQEENVLSAIVEDSRLACKAAALITLNGLWSIKFKYWLRWRWFYYVKQYTCAQLQPILVTGKKKVPLIQYYKATTSLIGVKDTLMQMRTQEVERILQEQVSAQLMQTERSDPGSQQPDTSSLD